MARTSSATSCDMPLHSCTRPERQRAQAGTPSKHMAVRWVFAPARDSSTKHLEARRRRGQRRPAIHTTETCAVEDVGSGLAADGPDQDVGRVLRCVDLAQTDPLRSEVVLSPQENPAQMLYTTEPRRLRIVAPEASIRRRTPTLHSTIGCKTFSPWPVTALTKPSCSASPLDNAVSKCPRQMGRKALPAATATPLVGFRGRTQPVVGVAERRQVRERALPWYELNTVGGRAIK